MRAELASLNHCAVPFLSRAAVNLIWYDSTYFLQLNIIQVSVPNYNPTDYTDPDIINNTNILETDPVDP